MSWTLFVEGASDKVFVEWLLGSLHVQTVRVVGVEGGVSHLRHVAPQIRRTHDEGRHVALLLDADTTPEDRRVELANEQHRLGLPVDRSFLLPDDTGPGTLETLLERMAPPQHQAVYGCSDAYEDCLRRLNRNYTTPGSKARIYAYCEAVGAKTGQDKEYDNPTHWNPEAPALEPLRWFLRGLVD